MATSKRRLNLDVTVGDSRFKATGWAEDVSKRYAEWIEAVREKNGLSRPQQGHESGEVT